jgi:Transposase IS66 family/IS66 C-terminal element
MPEAGLRPEESRTRRGERPTPRVSAVRASVATRVRWVWAGTTTSESRRSAIRGESVAIVEAAQDWGADNFRALLRARWRQVAGTVGRLHVDAKVGAAVVVADVPLQHTRGMALFPNNDVVQAVPAEGANHVLRECISLPQELTRFLGNARIPPDNNRSESALRVVAVGRRNFLFVGHADAGANIAGLYSLVAICEANGVNPLAYLTDVLGRLGTPSALDDLLPHRWKPSG